MPTIRVDTGTRSTTTRVATVGVQGPGGVGTEATDTVLGVVKLAGDLAGTADAVTVAKVRGRTVAATAPADGEGLVWNAGASQWEPGDVAITDADATTKGKLRLAGDFGGTADLPETRGIYGRAITDSTPFAGQAPTFTSPTAIAYRTLSHKRISPRDQPYNVPHFATELAAAGSSGTAP